eukprot:6407301-Ditylum_brightwellii.AAC.1
MESQEKADITGVIPTDETTSPQEEAMDVLMNNQDSTDESEPPTSSPIKTEQPSESTGAREDTQITGVSNVEANIDNNEPTNEEMVADYKALGGKNETNDEAIAEDE